MVTMVGWAVGGSPIYGGWVSYMCKSHNLQKVATSRYQFQERTNYILDFLLFPKDEKSSSIDAFPNKSN